MRWAPAIELSHAERKRLERIAGSSTASVRHARRAAIVLQAALGKTNTQIAANLRVGRVQVGRWRSRYAEGGWQALMQDLPRGGRPKRIDVQEIVCLSTQTRADNATHWSSRTLAAHTGVSATSIRRIWREHGLKPNTVHLDKNPS